MDKAFAIQNQIKENSRGISDYVSDLSKWESSMNKTDTAIKRKKAAKKSKAAPVAPP
jgi:hypothetical protein